jgi:hypothetical protein
VCELGLSKVASAARRIFEINPFQNLTIFEGGLTEDSMPKFFEIDNRQLDLFIEEMDNIKLKIETRFLARQMKIPVMMATDNGDNTIVDVERFDLEPDRPLFHGRVPEAVLKSVPDNPSMVDRVKLAGMIVGFDITPRTQESLMLVGAKIPAWPQLGNAATLSGVGASYIARKIILGEPMPSGRYEVHLDKSLDVDYDTLSNQLMRKHGQDDFIQGFETIFGKEDR